MESGQDCAHMRQQRVVEVEELCLTIDLVVRGIVLCDAKDVLRGGVDGGRRGHWDADSLRGKPLTRASLQDSNDLKRKLCVS